ncbi:MAG: inositol 2-dehydrogenase [Propionibacteriales bacterium]|nr:inositol 2-dehydrogenase [Propionibacteriales bacterium]
MVFRVGVIGTGNIGTDHANRIASQVSGADVVAVFDVATERAKEVASGVGAVAHATDGDVINDPEVDAVLIASPGELHAEQVLACIDAGKPVLCEKPLAPTTAECLKVIEAEVAAGRQLVQLGFMRRYDAAYVEVKAALDSGDIGEALMLHCLHRNPTAPDWFTSDLALTDSVVHEVDTSRWLLGDEIATVTVLAGKPSPKAGSAQDPQLVVFEMASGVLVTVESFIHAQYGYDVRCELVGSEGVASMDTPTLGAVTRRGGRTTVVPPDWRVRFGSAYQAELQAWVDSLASGEFHGASAWDGYAATAVAEAGLRARAEGARVAVELVDRPSFYAGK